MSHNHVIPPVPPTSTTITSFGELFEKLIVDCVLKRLHFSLQSPENLNTENLGLKYGLC